MVKERPILFKAEMVRAILEGRKTQTRRILKMTEEARAALATAGPPRMAAPGYARWEGLPAKPPFDADNFNAWSPFGIPGDRLWVVTIRSIEFGNGRFGAGDDGHIYRTDGSRPIRMRTNPNHNGYEEIRLRFNGSQRGLRVNRLVCEAFYGPAGQGEVARHLDGDRRNNRPENLDWGTARQNQADAAAMGSFSGERGSAAKLSRPQVNEIRLSNAPQAELARRFGVTQPTISRIRSGARWSATRRAPPPPNRARWASRITLEITDVRVERLQDISEEDARAEGVNVGKVQPAIINGERGRVMVFEPRKAFAMLWDSINGKTAPWGSNPWLWVISFRRTERAA